MANYMLPIITGTSLAVGDLLRWDGNDWVNYADSAYVAVGATIVISDGGTIRCAGAPIITFDDTNDKLEIENCDVGIGTVNPVDILAKLVVKGTAGAGYGSPQIAMIGRVTNQYTTIGFGYSITGTLVPAEIGYQDMGGGSYTKGDLVFATRNVVTSTAPSERMRIAADGGIHMISLKSGVDQAAAGAAANELWRDTNDDNTIKLGT